MAVLHTPYVSSYADCMLLLTVSPGRSGTGSSASAAEKATPVLAGRGVRARSSSLSSTGGACWGVGEDSTQGRQLRYVAVLTQGMCRCVETGDAG